MAGRLVIALLAAPWYGFWALVATVPLLALWIAAFLLWTTGAAEMTAYPADIGATIIVAVASAIAGFAAQVSLAVQQARYAASFSGTRSLPDQPRFGTAFVRGFWVMLGLAVLGGVVTFALSVAFARYWADLGLPALSPAELAAWAARAQLHLVGNPFGDPDVTRAGAVVEALRLVAMAGAVLLAMLLVPRVTGLGEAAVRICGAGHFLYRFAIAMPCLALMALILAELLVRGGLAVAGPEWHPLGLALRLNLQLAFFGAMAFAHEALMLRAVGEIRAEAAEILATVGRGVAEDPRAIRRRWSES